MMEGTYLMSSCLNCYLKTEVGTGCMAQTLCYEKKILVMHATKAI